MKVSLNHVEKTHGVIRKKTYHGVQVKVEFSAEEAAIIEKRGLWRDVVLERDADALTDPEKHEKKGLARKIVQASIAGADSLSFHLTVRKLRDGDTYYFGTPAEAKMYEDDLKQNLVNLKNWILGNEKIEQKSDTFEI